MSKKAKPLDKLAVFGNRLRLCREKANLTLSDIGDKLGVSYVSVGRWEKAESEPSLQSIVEMAEIYSESIDYLLTGKEPLPPSTSIDLASKLSLKDVDHLEECVVQDEGIPLGLATQKGDTVLVDKSVNEFKGQGLYLIQRPGEQDPVVRHLYQRGQGIGITDGPSGGDQPLAVMPEGTLVLGRVVGRFGPVEG